MATADPTTMTPVEIDTVLSDNYNDQARVQHAVIGTVRHLERLENKANSDAAKGGLSAISDAQVEAIRLTREDLAGLHQERTALITAAAPYEAEYYGRRWNRYFLVDNANGHVHRNMNCHTCFQTTVYTWLVDLADCDEDAMIEEWGERACTVCFPTAPANPNFNRPARRDREAQEARDAEKAEKAAAKAEKAITDVDGSPLRVEGDTFRTKVSARNELSRQIQNGIWYGPKVGVIEKLAVALQAAGVDWLPVAERAFKKAKKEAVLDPTNPFRLSPEAIAETQADIARNIAATQAVLEALRAYKGVMG